MKGDKGWLFIAIATWAIALVTLTDYRLMADIPAAWNHGMCNLMGFARVPFKYVAIAAGLATLIYWFAAVGQDRSEEASDEE
ncbi:hypothetical protein [Parasphingorhabdus sp.]|uniref:hypothetical protein n=1 Tax=Parasphingorhabdus sp. TaxID=2709688 RepID=UPI003D2E7D93